jgi:predicted nucleic acid-binding protein
MNGVFLDSVGLLALWNASDQWNAAAAQAHQRLIAEDASIWTTSLVLLECGNRVARRTDFREVVADFWDAMEESDNLIRPEPEDQRAAWLAYRRGEAAQAGIIDHVSFVVMRRLGLTRAFTNDTHFRAAGFETLF